MDINALDALADELEPQDRENHPAWMALHFALFHPDEFQHHQLLLLGDLAQAEHDGGMPVMPPMWFHQIHDQIEQEDEENDLWQPEDDQQEPHGVPMDTDSDASTVVDEDVGGRRTFREEPSIPRGRVGRF